MSLMIIYPKSKHHVYSPFHDNISNHVIESFHKTFKAWYKTKKGFHSFKSTLNIISNFLFYYHFIHSHSYLSRKVPVSVADVPYIQQQAKH